ncbi:hypothetical protein [Aquibacillus saliphilus]|uniref:hypothetical protein n=1 Tax=Aquibacillus saliphilus TaxID=1909422 RepID=UPI001CF02F7A|nr:hypothetical protein [Aquibacillus saliphilus]
MKLLNIDFAIAINYLSWYIEYPLHEFDRFRQKLLTWFAEQNEKTILKVVDFIKKS